MQAMIKAFMENSGMIFFKPTDNFWAFLSEDQWRWRRYVDIGAGVGHLTRLMRERGFDVDAIDKFARVDCEIDDMIVGDAAGLETRHPPYDFGINDVMLFARPCHGAFVGLCLRHNIETGDALYISKPHNAEDDLFGWVYEEVAQDVGEDGESIFRVWGKRGLMKTFHKIDVHGTGKADWWHYDDGVYRNDMGGGFSARGVEPVEVKEAAHSGMLQRSADGLLRPDYHTGWLAPDGTFYGCFSRDHESVAYDYLCSSTVQLEKMGFARLYGPQGSLGDMLWSLATSATDPKKKTPTKAQKEVLKAKGYDVREGDLLADGDFPI